MKTDLWEGMDVRKEFRTDMNGIRQGVYVLYIHGKEHSVHTHLNKAECEFLRTKGLDPVKYRGR